MEKAFKILKELQSTSGSNEKERIIRDNLDNELFVKVMMFLNNSFITTGLSSKKISKKISTVNVVNPYATLPEILDFLEECNSGSDVYIGIVLKFIEENKEHEEILKQIFTKSLKTGVDTLWNKTVPKEMQVPVFDVMLAKKFQDNVGKVKGQFVITKKLDGLRLVIIKENGSVKSFTRTGQPYEGLDEIEKDIQSLTIDNAVFDGELIADIMGSTSEIFAETQSKARSKGKEKTGLKFNIFDMLPVDEFKQGKSKLNAVQRKNNLTDLFSSNAFDHCLEVKPLYIGEDIAEISKWLDYSQINEWEGIMISLDLPYVTKRTDALLKVKVMQDCDVLVKKVIEGESKNKGKLGAITIEFEHENNKYECNCGSGFNDEERVLYFNNPELLVGKIVTLRYFEISSNKNGGFGLRFPIWTNKIRDDKTEISMN